MSFLGKFIGGVAGFAMGGPVGALFGAALGHAADEGKLHGLSNGFANFAGRAMPFDPLRIASMLGRREQVFAVGVTVLSAKLSKCDGPVSRTEIDAFKRGFAIPESSMAEIARLFDSARAQADGFEPYAVQLSQAFSDEKHVLEQVLASLYQIAKADGPINAAEADFLARTAQLFGLGEAAKNRAGQGVPPPQAPSEDPYMVLGLSTRAEAEEIRTRWKQLVRENHPDRVSATGASDAVVKQASEKVARINAAYDFLRRDKGF